MVGVMLCQIKYPPIPKIPANTAMNSTELTPRLGRLNPVPLLVWPGNIYIRTFTSYICFPSFLLWFRTFALGGFRTAHAGGAHQHNVHVLNSFFQSFECSQRRQVITSPEMIQNYLKLVLRLLCFQLTVDQHDDEEGMR